MAKGIKIRVPQGVKLSNEVKQALQQKFPNSELEEFSEKPNYKLSYARRVDSLHRAFGFLLGAYPRPKRSTPLSKETIAEHAAACNKAYIGRSDSIDALQHELEQYTSGLIDLICLAWQVNTTTAVELLNEAEQYAIMEQGRADLATLTPIDSALSGYVLQLDETIPAYSPEVLHELSVIKSLGIPKTPTWFRDLSHLDNHFIQAYLCHLSDDTLNLYQDIELLLGKWEEIKQQAENITNDLALINTAPHLVTWFTSLEKHHQETIRVLAKEKSITIDQRLNQLQKFIWQGEYKTSLACITKIPQWYWVLSEHQQYFLGYLLNKHQCIESIVSFLPSRLRQLPMPANFAKHSLFHVSRTGQFLQFYEPKYRSSHIASRDGLNWPLAVQHRHVQANLSKVMEQASADQIILFQTLISPIGSHYLSPLAKLIPDYKLDQMARTVVHDIRINHPFNKAKYLLYTKTNDENCLALIAAAEQRAPLIPELRPLIDHYKAILNSERGTATYNDKVARELFLSSLEQLIVLTAGGYSYGSCVSGKDRKAVELIHTDAMFLYHYKKNGAWPLFADSDENRAYFVSLVTDLYLSRHQHEHAGQNAPGSEGIKNAAEYFPSDISEEINRRLQTSSGLLQDDRLATNNEINKISRGTTNTTIRISIIGDEGLSVYLTPNNALLCTLIAQQLGLEKCTQIYDALYHLLGQVSLFTPRSLGFLGAKFPTGILQIKELMKSPLAGNDNVSRLSKIFAIILGRPQKDETRSVATRSVYRNLYSILLDYEHGTKQTSDEAIKEWTSLFKSSVQTAQRSCSSP